MKDEDGSTFKIENQLVGGEQQDDQFFELKRLK
jgi:hypothetical protein